MRLFLDSVALKLVMTPSSLFSSRTIFWPTSRFSRRADPLEEEPGLFFWEVSRDFLKPDNKIDP